MAAEPSLIEYPCAFPIKVMGRTEPGFAQSIVAIVKRHAPDFDPSSIEMRVSKKSRYLSLTCTIQDGHVWLASAGSTIELRPAPRCGARA